jgi:protein TonB
VARELKYPEVALRDSIQGTESVSFIINKEGKPETITILHSLGSPFDEESRRLIINMPPWKPARLNSQPVRAKITIPLTFSITKNAHP